MSSQLNRLYYRKKVAIPVQVIAEASRPQDNHTYSYNLARIYNMNKSGMYFETKHEIEVGSNICIKMTAKDQKTNKEDVNKVHYARVKWNKKIDQPIDLYYGIGVQIFDTLIQAEIS